MSAHFRRFVTTAFPPQLYGVSYKYVVSPKDAQFPTTGKSLHVHILNFIQIVLCMLKGSTSGSLRRLIWRPGFNITKIIRVKKQEYT